MATITEEKILLKAEDLVAVTCITKTEHFDADVMNALLADNTLSRKDRHLLAKYKKACSRNTCPVTYELASGCDKLRVGRLIPRGQVGLQAFPRYIRNPLLSRFYRDIDIENAHYTLLVKIAEDNKWNCDSIKYYVENRDECLAKLSPNRDIAKQSFLKVAFGGNIKAYDEHADDLGLPEGNTDLLKKIEEEIKHISENIWNKHPQLHAHAKKKSTVNPKFRLMSLLLQTEERKCLMAMERTITSQGRELGVLIHDGGCIRVLHEDEILPPELLRTCEEQIKLSLGYDVKILIKPMTHNFVLPENSTIPLSILINDSYAAAKFIEFCGDNILLSNGRLYFFDEKAGIWTCEDSMFERLIEDAGTTLVFRQLDEEGKIRTFDYSGDTKRVDKLKKKVVPVMMSSFKDKCNDEFLEKGRERTFGKLLFVNGLYDFKTATFSKEFDRNLVFQAAVPHAFVEEAVEDDIAFIKKNLFETPFSNPQDAKVFLHYLMRGMIGDYQAKHFLTMMGMTNSSKGCLVNSFQYWFGNVVATFQANHLLFKQNGDASRDIAFLIPIANCRLAFSSEVKLGGHVDSNLLKMIVSGGDELRGRRIYENDQAFVNRSTIVMMCNDMPPLQPADDAVANRMIPIQYSFSFVEKPNAFKPHEKKADSELKNTLRQAKYSAAMIHIFMREYSSWIESGMTPPKLTALSKEMREDIAPTDTFKDALESKYEITNNADDYVPFDELYEYLTNCKKLTMTKVKLGMLLTTINVGATVKLIKKKTVRIRTGIRIDPEWRDEREQGY